MEWTKVSPNPPHCRKPTKKCQSASALPGDAGNNQAQLCTWFQWHPPPGSPMGLPGKFQGCRNGANSRYTSVAYTFCVHSATYYIICIVVLLYTKYISLSMILCETSKASVVQCRGMQNHKNKNKCQVIMMKGNGSASRQQAWGNDQQASSDDQWQCQQQRQLLVVLVVPVMSPLHCQGCPMGLPCYLYGSVKIFPCPKLHIRMQIKMPQNLAIY